MDQSPAFSDPDELRTAIALFRHSLVAPLASEDLERGELAQELRRIARRRHKIPGSLRERVSVPTLRRWLARFRKKGLEGLQPGLRSDYGTSRAIPENWIVRAMQLRTELSSRSTRVLVEILERLPGCPKINVHTLDQTLRRRGMPRQPLPSTTKKRKIRWTAEHVMAVWQGDCTPGIWLPDPRDPGGKKLSTALYLWLDDVSRLVPHAEFFHDEKLPRMERTLKMGLLSRGVPVSVYTDRGHVYRAHQFAAAMAELTVNTIKSRRHYPQGRGKIERIFGVIQADFYPEVYKAIRGGYILSIGDLNEALWAWLERIYHCRVHSETDKTPLQAYDEGLRHVKPADPVKLARAFLWRYTRRVSKNGFISLFGNSYTLDPAWWGQKLELRLDPFDLSRVDVYRDRRPVARAAVRELKKSSVPGLDLVPLVAAPVLPPSGISFLDALRQEYRQQRASELGEISFREAVPPSSYREEEDP